MNRSLSITPLFVRCSVAVTAAATLSSSLSGCASIESVHVAPGKSVDGLMYFLPTRDIEVSITVPNPPGAISIAVQATTAKPDFKNAFVARVPRSALGNVKGNVQVNAQGLLNSESSSQITSSLTAILQSAAGAAGGVQPFGVMGPTADDSCSPGTYSFIIPITSGGTWKEPGEVRKCKIKFTVVPPAGMGSPTSALPAATGEPKVGKSSSAGLFYRLAIPYVVKATGPTESREFLVFSPTGSPTYFLPVAKAAFGSNEATFAFDSGVPTKYGQTIQGELAGVIGLPATLLQSYFKAIGDMFGSRKGSAEGEKAYIEALNALALAQQKRSACSSAVAANDSARITVDCK